MTNSVRRSLFAAPLAVCLVLAGCGGDDATDTSSSTSSSSSSTTTSTTRPSSEQPDGAVWPFVDSTTRYAEPAQAAGGFAVDFLGFVDPIVGTFAPGDARSGEVTVQARATGPVTTVLLRQLTPDDTWWVLGATTPNLQLDAPAAGSSITSPVTLSGQSTAVEGTVNVEVRADGTVEPLASGFVTGGANGEMGAFTKAIPFGPPTASDGAIVLKTLGGENGVVWEATVARVHFG